MLYWRFFNNFARLARHLNDLLLVQENERSAKVQRELSEAQEATLFCLGRSTEGFRENWLINPPVLGYADYSKTFLLLPGSWNGSTSARIYWSRHRLDASRSLRKSEKAYRSQVVGNSIVSWLLTWREIPACYRQQPSHLCEHGSQVGRHEPQMASTLQLRLTTYRRGATHADADGLNRCLSSDVVQATQHAVSSEATPLTDRVNVI